MKSRAKLVAAAAALVIASGIAMWHATRERLAGVGSFVDAAGNRYAIEDAAVRHAVFETPKSVTGELNSASDELRSALSEDGRWLVFAVGTRGSNVELWIGECAGKSVRALRRLSEIDTSADECAPCFGPGALWFASDRPGGAGGLDLYRAAFDGESFGPAERLPDDWQSNADDTDPTPLPHSRALVFVSDRDGSSRAYEAPEPESGTGVRPLAGLGVGVHEPSFARDGRSLWFARERNGSFDIHRAERRGDDFCDVGAVPALATAADERAPFLVEDGFEILFARKDSESGGYDLSRMRTSELLRVPALAWTWLEIGTIAALLILALMAFLSDRWPALDTLYRCYLISVLIHLLLALWLQHVYVERGSPAEIDRGRKVRVKLAPSASSLTRASRERGGDVSDLATAPRPTSAPERALLSPLAETPTRLAVPMSAAELRPTPEAAPDSPRRADLAPADRVADSKRDELRDAEELERVSAAPQPVMELAASPLGSAPRRESTPGPSRAAFGAIVSPRDESRARPMEIEGPRIALSSPTTPREEAAPSPISKDARLLDREVSSAPRASAPAGGPADLGLVADLADSAAKLPVSARASAPSRASLEPLASEERAVPALPNAIEAPHVALGVPAAPRSEIAPPVASDVSKENLLDRESRAPGVVPAPKRGAPADMLSDWIDPAARPVPAAAIVRADLEHRREDEAVAAPALESLAAVPFTEAPAPAPPARSDWAGTPYENRSGTAKERALEDHGGSVETERAVERGLEYLASVQTPRGNFGKTSVRDAKYGQVAIGKTGLALLAFLGAGHTPTSNTRFSDVSRRALEYLVGEIDPESGQIGAGDAYSHGIAAYALAEAYALTKEPRWREPLERAVQRIVSAQSRSSDPRLGGGWSYYYADGRTFDRWSRTAITSWQVMALESARLSGLSIDDRVFAAAARFLEDARDPDTDYVRYSHDPSRIGSDYPTLPASTPAALFALSILGRDIDSAEYATERRFVVERAPRGFRFTTERDFVHTGQGNPYFHYHGTLAMFRAGGGAWKTWNEALKRTLLPAQNGDGSWTPIDVYARYARDDENDMSYTTALCVLSLEVYYRYYLPLFKVTVR